LGHTVFELNLWAKLEQRAALFARLQAGEVVQNFELELRTKSGRVRQVLFSGTLMKVGDESCLLGSALDISERNRAERQIAEATHYVQTLLAASPIGIITFRADGQAVSANEAAARLVGTTVEKVKQQNFRELESWKKSNFLERAERALATGQEQLFEDHTVSSYGRAAWLSVRFVPFRYAGEPHLLLLAQDISERKRAEEAIRESEQRYQQLFELAADAVILVDSETHRYMDVNQATQRLYGYSREEFLQMTPEDVSTEPEKTRDHINQAEAFVAHRWHRKKNGEHFAVEISANQITYRGRPTALVALRDITARLRAEQKVAESEVLYRGLFELESDALVLVDSETHRFVEVNRSAERLYGYTQNEFLTMTAEQVSAEPEKTRATVGAGRVFVPLRWHRKKNGERFPVEITASVIVHKGRRVELTAIRDTTTRQQVLERMEAAAAQLLEAQRVAKLGSYVFEVATGTWTSSRVLDELFGLPEAGVTRDVNGWLQLVHPQDRAEMQRHLLKDVLQGHAPFDHVYRVNRLSDGKERWVHGLGKVVLDASGKAVQMVGVIQDITERKQAEAEAQLLTQRLKLATNAALIGIWDWDLKADQWFATDTYFTMLGYGPEEGLLDRDRWVQRIHPDDRATVEKKIKAVLAENAPYEYEARMRHADGSYRWINVIGRVLAADEQGKVTRMIGVRMDITERKVAEEQMNLQFSALTAAANGIAITARNGKIEWVNPAFTRLTGYSAEEAVGNFPRVLKSGQHPPGFYATLWATIVTGNVWHGELINKRKDGGLYTEEMTITPVRGADGEIAHFVAIKQDVTERHQLENQLRQSQKMEAVGTLAGGIAHDFNNILGAIISFTEVSKMDNTGNAELVQNLDEVLKASHRAADLVRQILSFSRRQKLERRSVALAPVVKEALKLLRATLPATISIETDLGDDLPAVLADPTQIHQVIMNLGANSAHAMRDQPGRLRVQLDAYKLEPGATTTALAAGDYVRLTFSDTGHGMDATTAERIFEPFFTTKDVGKGTGLGLSVVHGIVKEHEGAITVASEPGQGTTFTLYLPAQVATATATAAAGQEIPAGGGERIMFVDDEAVLGEVARKMLRRLGYQPFIFTDANAAWQAFQENASAYDLLISDLTMPEMTGVELAKRVSTLRPGLPIILSFGLSGALTAEELQAAGVQDFLGKPLHYEALARALKKGLRPTAGSR